MVGWFVGCGGERRRDGEGAREERSEEAWEYL